MYLLAIILKNINFNFRKREHFSLLYNLLKIFLKSILCRLLTRQSIPAVSRNRRKRRSLSKSKNWFGTRLPPPPRVLAGGRTNEKSFEQRASGRLFEPRERERERRRREGKDGGAEAKLVRFEIVGPLLIQADIIGGVCYLHTLVPPPPRTRSYNEEEHGKPLRAILGVDRRCYRRPTACCSPTWPHPLAPLPPSNLLLRATWVSLSHLPPSQPSLPSAHVHRVVPSRSFLLSFPSPLLCHPSTTWLFLSFSGAIYSARSVFSSCFLLLVDRPRFLYGRLTFPTDTICDTCVCVCIYVFDDPKIAERYSRLETVRFWPCWIEFVRVSYG